MIRIILLVILIVIVMYVIYKLFPKLKLFLVRLIKSPFIFIILKNLIKLLFRKF
jgi:hypothetical protein